MTSQEASHILAAISIPEDRLHALEFVKRLKIKDYFLILNQYFPINF